MLSNAWIGSSPVEVYVQRACDPSLPEPNYALNYELAEYITKKKANTPRDAAMAIVHLVNHRNPRVSILALALLDTLVKTCGYPFHLQISTKEFLNELVRRFPERPPPFPGPVMSRILGLIHEWKEGICKESRWKEDLGNIRDMHRLLSFKGYRFNDYPRSSSRSGNASATAAASATANLKSPDELESEDREAQAAKLQELIRRGTPRDLAAAQELMKIMAGADPDQKPDYRSQTLHELEKVQSKVILLNDLLDNVDTSRGEKFVPGDAYDQVATICRQARPKIQKWISDAETDDPESLETFLSINDLINNVLDRYERYKNGDYTSAPASAPETKKTDLIDLLDDPQPAQGSSTAPVDELADIFGSSSYSNAPSNFNTSSNFNSPPFAPPNLFGVSTSGTASPPMVPFGATFGSGGALGGIALPTSRSGTPVASPPHYQHRQASSLQQQSRPQAQTQPQSQPQAQTQNGKADPFADLAGLF